MKRMIVFLMALSLFAYEDTDKIRNNNANGSVVTEGQNDLAPAKVLVQVRDYATGNLTLKVVGIDKAPLTGSLWRIEVK